jgi:protein TilB
MAVNSVRKIEGVRRCESLNKLDMTLNFIDVEDLKESIEELEFCENLQELFLTGNPCTEWKDYKDYIVAKLPQLVRLEGDDINRSQRLAAKAKLKKLEDDLEVLAKASIEKKEFDKKEGKFNPDAYTPENRWRDYVETKERKEEEEAKRKKESMFKDYNDMVEEEKKNVSGHYC